MFSKETKAMMAEQHYEDFKEEVMDNTCIAGLQVTDRVIGVCNDMVNGIHNEEAFDAGREIVEMMECMWVREQFENINGFNDPDFLGKYETKTVTDLRVKMHGQNEYARGFEDAAQTWERNFANMSGYEFSNWKLKHQDIIKHPLPSELNDVYTDEPTPEEEQAWVEFANRISRGDS